MIPESPGRRFVRPRRFAPSRRVDANEHPVGGAGVDVAAAGARHERQHVEASLRRARPPRRRGRALRASARTDLRRAGRGTFAGLAEGLAGVGRRHELDVAAASGTHMPTCAPSVGTVASEKSTTGMPKTSRKVVEAASKSCMAMAMRGMAVITAPPDVPVPTSSPCSYDGGELGGGRCAAGSINVIVRRFATDEVADDPLGVDTMQLVHVDARPGHRRGSWASTSSR